MKKEYLILIIVILALSGYLIFKKDDRSHYSLPEPPAVEKADVDRLTVAKEGETLEFVKQGDGWVVGPDQFPADKGTVADMLDTVSGLTLSALVSEKKDYLRYELDDDHRVDVTAFTGEKPALSFKIGKTAPSYNHTFVMLGDDSRIFHAEDSFRSHFDKVLDDFRDKEVMTVPEEGVKKITIEKNGVEKQLTAQDKGDAGEETDSPKKIFLDEAGSQADPETVSNLLSALSALRCDTFLTDATKADLEKEGPALTIRLETDSPLVLRLFDQDTEAPVRATSSMNAYAFKLQSYTAKDIQSYADALAGLQPEKEEEAAE